MLYSTWGYYAQPTICFALPGDITTEYSLCSVWRYTTPDYLMCSTLPGDTMYYRLTVDITTDYSLYVYRLSALLYLAICYTRLSYVIYSIWRHYT
jgi:hypothetical protein